MTITLRDSNTSETYEDLDTALAAAAEWYDYLQDDPQIAARLSERGVETLPPLDQEPVDSIDELNARLDHWKEQIAEAAGYKTWHGHGNYAVSAACEMGLTLCAEATAE